VERSDAVLERFESISGLRSALENEKKKNRRPQTRISFVSQLKNVETERSAPVFY